MEITHHDDIPPYYLYVNGKWIYNLPSVWKMCRECLLAGPLEPEDLEVQNGIYECEFCEGYFCENCLEKHQENSDCVDIYGDTYKDN
jgi:hypothetical protein